MKNHILCVFSLLLSIWSSACSDKTDTPEAPDSSIVTISVSQEAFTSPYDGASFELTVNSTADWAIRSNADWCKVTPSGGSKNQATVVKVTIMKNTSQADRTATLEINSSGAKKNVDILQTSQPTLEVSTDNISLGGQASHTAVTIITNLDWTAESNASWCKVSPEAGTSEDNTLEIDVEANATDSSREAIVTLKAAGLTKEIKVSQFTDVITVPEGYTLVWHDEFNKGTVPGPDWVLENQPAGWVNNELQNYTSREIDGKRTVEVHDGFLWITCFKAADGKIYSGRMNAKPSSGWLYGYFEARINLPKGKGTWPAFWMMPCNVDWGSNPWPKCGEIDIMEEVGADPNQVSSSIHTQNYNHTINTQKTHSMYCAGAEGEFHIYALEWTADKITTYVDGKVQLSVSKAQLGADHDSWPFHYAFYPILNLAWGGDWGGYKGVDNSALPATMKVDYVRIFQKK
ncbi:MAG: family 16 glycosylhydrolase [Muribaculum sp.]|nr:family 16 glycosylhydrolase [Muribaculum sp.]